MGNNHTFNVGGSVQYNGAKTNMDYIVSKNYVVYSCVDCNLNFRKGVRNGCFVVDVELFEYGFSAGQNVGWANVSSYC